MAKLKLEHCGEEIELANGEPIAAVCEEAGLPFGCVEGGCGTCCIEVRQGIENLSPLSAAEEDFFGEVDGERLACQCRIERGEVTIRF